MRTQENQRRKLLSHDESEHEDYSDYRNYGETITKWYRDSLVFIVPNPSGQAFVSSSTDLFEVPTQVPVLEQKAQSSEEAKRYLHQTCKMLSATRIRNTQVSDLIASCALEHDWLNLFDALSLESRQSPSCIRTIGQKISKQGLSHLKDTLERVLCSLPVTHHELGSSPSGTPTSKGWKLLQDLHKHFFECELTQIQFDELNVWSKDLCSDILMYGRKDSPNDVEALARMATIFGINPVKRGLDNRLIDRNVSLLVLFLTRFWQFNVEKSEEHLSGLDEFVDVTWAQFTWRNVVPPIPAVPNHNPYSAHRPMMGEKPSKSLTFQETCHLLEATNTYHPQFLDKVVRILTSKLKDLKGNWECFANRVLPLIRLVASQNFRPLNLQTHSELQEFLSLFVKAALHMYIEEYVGRRVMPPKTWAILVNKCPKMTCSLCAIMVPFLSDPNRQILEYLFEIEAQDHITSRFLDTETGLDIVAGRKPGFKPIVPVYTKVMARYHAHQAKQEKARSDVVADLLQRFQLGNRIIERLLGIDYNHFMTGEIQKLPEQVLVTPETPAFGALRDLGATAVNTRSNKRSSDTFTDAENNSNSAKKQRGHIKAEVIDLT